MLEHIQRLAPVFGEAARVLRPGGWLWTSELHPYRQWRGAQAHFRDAEGCLHIPDCYPHSFSDYLRAARARGLELCEVSEPPEEGLPRLLVLGFQRRAAAATPGGSKRIAGRPPAVAGEAIGEAGGRIRVSWRHAEWVR